VAEVIKITSPVEVKNRIQNMPKAQSADAIFDLTDPEGLSKDPGKIKKAEEEGPRQELLKNLNKEIYLPLLNQTKVQADSMRRLILYSKLFEISSGVITEDFLNELFVLPKELLTELLKREEAATVFKGDFFDALRVLVKSESHPKLQDAILTILKYFDCYVNQNNSLQSVLVRSNDLLGLLLKQDRQILEQQINKLEVLIDTGKDNYKEIIKFLKNEFVPVLRGIAANYSPSDKVYDQMLSVIHYIVRYDKADQKLLEDAFLHFAEELKPLFSHLMSEDIADMKETLLSDAKTVKAEADNAGKAKGIHEAPDGEKAEEKTNIYINEEKDTAELLTKALSKESPSKMSSAAQNLLLYMVQSESPMLPLLHFMIPLRFLGEDTYGEFFIDKECKEKKGEAGQATNIFFTIQSDLYGTFEVDLLAKDRNIELDIKCPKELIASVRETRQRFRDTIEGAGYRLAGYQVGEYTESKTILKRFPELMKRKAGIDVKI
jgi:hypothetical protein